MPREPSRTLRVWSFRLFLLVTLFVVGAVGWASIRVQDVLSPTQVDPTLIALATSLNNTSTPTAPWTPSPVLPSDTPAPTRIASSGTLILAIRVSGWTHLWAYVPGDSNAVQITGGSWDDLDPAVSPDGTQIAFTSRRSGYWDLYVLDIRTGEIRQLTDTPGFEGHPTWSPDGLWIAFEAYYDGDYDIWIMPVDLGQAPIQLTDHPAADYSPSWDPLGRRIAFVSHREGSPDVFLADLDHPDDRFRNLTRTVDKIERNPAFSPDGYSLAYSESASGLDLVMLLNLNDLTRPPLKIGQGQRIAWAPDGRRFVAVLQTLLNTHLQAYALNNGEYVDLPVIPLNDVESVYWTAAGLPGEVYSVSRAQPTMAPLFEVGSSISASDRRSLVDLPGVTAPHAALSDAVDEAFLALKTRSVETMGWDFLKSLDNAFVGLNDPMPPGFAYNDWLYTGRAFVFSSAAIQAGWVEFVRQDLGGQTYWHVYVLAGVQDGSLGMPLRDVPWDFDTRHNGDPITYDQGGSLRATLPQGYYVDFTQLAADFGFERLPAMTNWRTFHPGARYNEFVRTDGLDWTGAMLEFYPASALVTPTPFRTPTRTPTRTPRPTATPWWWRWRTPSPTPTQITMPTPTDTP